MANEGTDNWTERARQTYEDAVFTGDWTAMLQKGERELDAVEADLMLARGRLMHTRRQMADNVSTWPTGLEYFERSLSAAEDIGDTRRAAEAEVWVGISKQAYADDPASAVPDLERGAALAEQVGDQLTLSYALRHLGIAAHTNGDLDTARRHLTESTRLREELGFVAGTAANLVGLAYVASAQGQRDEARAHLDRAEELARSRGAGALLDTIHLARAYV